MTALLNIVMTLAAATSTATGTRPAAGNAAPIEKLLLDGKADEAIDKGRTAVAAHPNDLDLRLALARALAAKARHQKRLVNVAVTQKELDQGQIAVPSTQLDQAASQIEYDSGLFEEAILHLDYAIKRAPQRQDLRVFQCFILTDAGKIDRAKAAITSTLSALPSTPALAGTMAAYGTDRAKRDDPRGGAQLLAPVAAAFPKEATVQADYGNLLTRLGRKTEAYAALDRATAIAPQDVRYLRTKAVSAMLLRDYRRSQGAFATAFRYGQGVADQFASFVAAYGTEPKNSAGLMKKLAAPAPGADKTVMELADGFVRAGTAGPSSQEAMTLARKLAAAEQYVFSIPVLDRALQANPNNAEAKTLIHSAYAALGCPSLSP